MKGEEIMPDLNDFHAFNSTSGGSSGGCGSGIGWLIGVIVLTVIFALLGLK